MICIFVVHVEISCMFTNMDGQRLIWEHIVHKILEIFSHSNTITWTRKSRFNEWEIGFVQARECQWIPDLKCINKHIGLVLCRRVAGWILGWTQLIPARQCTTEVQTWTVHWTVLVQVLLLLPLLLTYTAAAIWGQGPPPVLLGWHSWVWGTFLAMVFYSPEYSSKSYWLSYVLPPCVLTMD